MKAKIIAFDKAKIIGIAPTNLLVRLGCGKNGQMSRHFKESHKGLEESFIGQQFSCVIKEDDRIAPNNRVYPFMDNSKVECVDVRESTNVEFKESGHDLKPLAKAIAAANNVRESMDLYVGIRDDGSVIGLNNTVSDCDQCEAKWSNTLAQILNDPVFVYNNIKWEWVLTTGKLLYLILHITPSDHLLWVSGSLLPVRNSASSPLLQGRDIESFILQYHQKYA